MPLKIETFSNHTGGNALYKALTHPKAFEKMQNLLREFGQQDVAIYDPLGWLESILEFYGNDFKKLNLTNIYCQNFDHIGKSYPQLKDLRTQPLTDLSSCKAKDLLVLTFEKDRFLPSLTPYLPKGMAIHTLDAIRVGELKDTPNYLNPLNFATNFVFFREKDGFHTRLVTANYWNRYGAKNVRLSCILFDEDGKTLAQWEDPLNASDHTVTLDSQEIQKRFNLEPFVGQLFFHVIGAQGHDIVKYALNSYHDDAHLSCTHDANSWPADSYAGLPAPQEDESVYFWIQNSHPVPIPANTIGLNIMGKEKEIAWLNKEIKSFASYRLDVAELLPEARWPEQIEMQTGKYMVRPRYEVVCKTTKNQRIAHVNVQRNDLKQTISVADLKPLFGKNFILPAPILPQKDFRSLALPTPMSTTQTQLPIKIFVYDSSGEKVAEQSLGVLGRDHATVVDCTKWSLPSGHGHMELAYEEEANVPVDGWLHGLFRYERGAYKAETSFGAHIFNTALVYKNEPQSYAGPPPGLRTRLFLGLNDGPHDTGCFLIYPSSTPWHSQSQTELLLHNQEGQEIDKISINIPCSGSYLFSYHQSFTPEQRNQAKGGYIIVRDVTCRLFGYHGTFGKEAFSFDHMFGF